MMRARLKLLENRDADDSCALICQLNREITCLQRQLDRLLLLDGHLDSRTLDTYREMITTRREMLVELGT